MTARDEVRGTVRVAMSAGMLEYLGRTTLVDFMSRYPEVRLQLRLSSQRVDLINERIDVAFRVATRFDTDQSLAMRSLGVGARILPPARRCCSVWAVHRRRWMIWRGFRPCHGRNVGA
ncbi:LysR substrate-binding domain-containing protein [Halopseudomonas pachastrellae]|nr:LysR substrate-binding domain-containing protein [Halopseudomonas pachastrellae]